MADNIYFEINLNKRPKTNLTRAKQLNNNKMEDGPTLILRTPELTPQHEDTPPELLPQSPTNVNGDENNLVKEFLLQTPAPVVGGEKVRRVHFRDSMR